MWSSSGLRAWRASSWPDSPNDGSRRRSGHRSLDGSSLFRLRDRCRTPGCLWCQLADLPMGPGRLDVRRFASSLGGRGEIAGRWLIELPELPASTIVGFTTGATAASFAALAAARGAWLRVDSAFGLWAAALPALRHLVRGADGADSWTVHGRKWLNVPYDSGYVLARDDGADRASRKWLSWRPPRPSVEGKPPGPTGRWPSPPTDQEGSR